MTIQILDFKSIKSLTLILTFNLKVLTYILMVYEAFVLQVYVIFSKFQRHILYYKTFRIVSILHGSLISQLVISWKLVDWDFVDQSEYRVSLL